MSHGPAKIFLSAICLLALAITGRAQDAAWKIDNDNGWAASQNGNLKDARLFLQKAAEYAEKKFGDRDPRLGLSLACLAYVHAAEHDQTAADSTSRRAFAILDKAATDAPETARGLNALGLGYSLQKRYAEAESVFRRALALETKFLGATHTVVGQISANLASACEAQGKYAEAEDLLHKAVDVCKASASPGDMARLESNLGAVCYNQRKYAEARTAYQEALRLRRIELGTDKHLEVALVQHNLATVFYELGKFDPAEALFKKARATRREKDETKLRYAATLHGLANVYKAQKRVSDALKDAREELKVKVSVLGPSSLEVAACHEYLATILKMKGEPQGVERELRTALDIRQKAARGRESSSLRACRDKLAKALEEHATELEKTKDGAVEAKKLRAEAGRLRDQAPKK